MKKLFLVMAALALYQNWGKVESVFRPAPVAAAGQTEVVLYATAWCGYCKKTRELLADEGVTYVEFDIEKSAEGRRRYQALNGRGVPVLTVGDTVIHGYQEKEMRRLLK